MIQASLQPAALAPAPRPVAGKPVAAGQDVLRLAADGRSAAAIAAEVFLSAGTVRNHLSAAIGKTGAGNRAQAVRVAQDKGWI